MTIDARSDILERNLADVRGRIADACRRARRDPKSVRLVAVTKYVSPDAIRALLRAGVVELGESRVQQLVERAELLGADVETPLTQTPPRAEHDSPRPRWHMIGHLQRNKVRALLPHARVVHSLDSERLAVEIQAQAERLDAVVDAFLEVNVAGEAQKAGVSADSAARLAEAVCRHSRIRLRGLMAMAPLNDDPEAARPHFAALRESLDELRRRGVVPADCDELSMGMSQDYAVAVEEGATLVRVGSALFEGLGAP